MMDVMSFVSGGYFVARPTRRPPHISAELLPERILTASDCIVDLAPNTWASDWTHDPQVDRLAKARRFGLDEEGLEALTRWATSGITGGQVAWPGMLLSLDAALEMKRLFLSPNAIVFGISLPEDLRARFLEHAGVPPGQGAPGVVQAVEKKLVPAEGGSVRGFDVLGWDAGTFHSYLCNGLESNFKNELSIVPNEHGFFDSESDARRCAERANNDTSGVEPGLWLPWLVRCYDE
jgi:hypothetical protein